MQFRDFGFMHGTCMSHAIPCKNKTGTSKVGAISKAQKAQKTFF